MIIFPSKILCQFIWKRSWNLFFSLLYMFFDMIKFLGNFVVHETVKLDLRQCVNCKQTKNLLTHIINILFHTISTIVCVDTCILKNETVMFTFGMWKVDIKQDTFRASYSDSLFPPSVWRIHCDIIPLNMACINVSVDGVVWINLVASAASRVHRNKNKVVIFAWSDILSSGDPLRIEDMSASLVV